MKHLCCNKVLFLLFTLLSLIHAKTPEIGFYYGDEPTSIMIEQYDWMVVDPSQLHPVWIKRYQQKLFAYVSVGEIEPWRHKESSIPENWKLSTNDAWGGIIADLSNTEYQKFLLSNMQTLYDQGYRNFFLDTLDSIFGVKQDSALKSVQKEALAQLLKQIRTHFPKAKIIANRGVEVMDSLCKYVDAFAIESLYQGLNTDSMTYKQVPQKDRTWIKAQLNKAKACDLYPISIDYVDPKDQDLRIKTAQKITADGYIPFVSDIHLKYRGNGKEVPIKREVLLLYNSAHLKDHDVVYSNMHLMVSMPLEHLGYIPILKDIQEGLPDAGIERYSGVIIWPDEIATNQDEIFSWIQQRIQEGQKFLFINDFNFEMNAKRAEVLGLEYTASDVNTQDVATITYKDKMVGYELPAFIQNLSWLPKVKKGEVLIRAKNSKGESFDGAAIMPWGAYAIGNSVEMDIGKEPHWIIDPFTFIQRGLHLKPFPVPDPTTLNGKRILFAHVDGDGFIEKARFDMKKYASQVLYHDILKRYKMPHSISIIEGEIGEKGLYPKLSPKMEKIARSIFKLPYVEPASHTYSHPFKWQKLKNKDPKHKGEGAYHLPIKGYSFNLHREVKESLSYIDKKLLPKGKRCKLFFWSGDCLPYEDAMWMCEKDDVKSINGGDTTIDNNNPWLGRIAPYGLQRKNFWQTYVGEQNENIYTNDWLGPYWGYRRAIDTFRITESPRRLKPINIYYHFYSASKTASLDALHRVYDWALAQETIAIYTSEYIDIAQDFYATSITQDSSGYHIKNRGDLKTLRIPTSLGYPNLSASKGILGFKKHNNVRYIHLDGSGDYHLALQQTAPTQKPYLIDANTHCIKKGTHRYQLDGYMPLKAHFYLPKGCHVRLNKKVKKSISHQILTLKSNKKKSLEVNFVCR